MLWVARTPSASFMVRYRAALKKTAPPFVAERFRLLGVTGHLAGDIL